jgi:hypothetical protein
MPIANNIDRPEGANARPIHGGQPSSRLAG